MFLRANHRKRTANSTATGASSNRVAWPMAIPQRQVLYLGEINDTQEAAWRKTIEVFDEEKRQSRQVSLFPCDRAIPPDEVNALALKLTEMQLAVRAVSGIAGWGAGCGSELGLDRFWRMQLAGDRGGVPWAKVLQCWRSTGCATRAASSRCIAAGFAQRHG